MKQRIRISVGLFHYFAGLALFVSPLLSHRYTPEGIVDCVIGAVFIASSTFARFELGVLRLLAYKEHLSVVLSLSVILVGFSVVGAAIGNVQLNWLVVGALSSTFSGWALKLHHVNRRRVLTGKSHIPNLKSQIPNPKFQLGDSSLY